MSPQKKTYSVSVSMLVTVVFLALLMPMSMIVVVMFMFVLVLVAVLRVWKTSKSLVTMCQFRWHMMGELATSSLLTPDFSSLPWWP